MKARKVMKTALVTGATALALGGTAVAQSRAPPQMQGRAVPRNPAAGRAAPRAQPMNRIPPQLRTGVRIGHSGFSADFYFYRGPLGGFEGYVRYGNFYPFGCGPVPMSYFEIKSRQFMNGSRFGPTIGEQKMLARGGYGHYVYNAWGQMVPAPPGIQTGDQSPVNNSGVVTYNNGATEEEVEDIAKRTAEDAVRKALEEKEREWAPRPSDTEERKHNEDGIEVNLRYGGKIDRIQYDDVGIAYLQGIFEAMRKLTNNDVDLMPINTKEYEIAIKDLNTKDADGNPTYAVLGRIDMQNYQNCLNPDQLTRQLFSDLSRSVDFGEHPGLPTRADAMLQVSSSGYSASSCR